MNNLFINNNLSNNQEIENCVTEQMQNNFLETTLGKTLNGALDIGIKAIMPDFIENEVINIKNNFITQGFEAGVNSVINNSIDLGKNVIGIFTGNFTDISQAERAVMKGGIIDGISGVVDLVLDKIQKSGKISKEIVDLIKDGKDVLLNNMENKIKKNFKSQVANLENININMESWNKYYSSNNLEKMNKVYEKIQDELSEIMPLDSVMKSAKQIENLQTIINNNNGNFDLSKEQIELSKILV